MCTSIPALQAEAAMVQSLQVLPALVRQTLTTLAEWGLIGGDGVHYTQVQAMDAATYREIKQLF